MTTRAKSWTNRWAILAVAVIATGGPARGQVVSNSLGTQSIRFQEERVGGVLEGCALAFVQLLQDFVYAKGAPVYISGSIGLEAVAGQASVSLKLVPFDVRVSATGEPTGIAFDPAYAYATFGTTSTAGKERNRFRCDQGGFCASYVAPDVLNAFALAQAQGAGFHVAYDRQSGGLDVGATVNMPTPAQPEWQQMLQFHACLGDLLRGATGH